MRRSDLAMAAVAMMVVGRWQVGVGVAAGVAGLQGDRQQAVGAEVRVRGEATELAMGWKAMGAGGSEGEGNRRLALPSGSEVWPVGKAGAGWVGLEVGRVGVGVATAAEAGGKEREVTAEGRAVAGGCKAWR